VDQWRRPRTGALAVLPIADYFDTVLCNVPQQRTRDVRRCVYAALRSAPSCIDAPPYCINALKCGQRTEMHEVITHCYIVTGVHWSLTRHLPLLMELPFRLLFMSWLAIWFCGPFVMRRDILLRTVHARERASAAYGCRSFCVYYFCCKS